VFPNIKNKFRFVTVSLMLGSLVTVISSASATAEEEDLVFDISVTSCGNSPADWAPAFESYTIGMTETPWPVTPSPISAQQGDTVTIKVDFNFSNGSNDCGATNTVMPNGSVSSLIVFPSSSSDDLGTMDPGASASAPFSPTIIDYFWIETDATIATVTGTHELTWTPDVGP
jgi:hypothetical protein